ncbi:hypothetical protein [Actinocorallia longicatena]|uniref:Uncharacterized protein n=1 Tax=Actinocorallia longicatena TaxID=111803 RepID=A0ABP6Q3S9_9ACTN
MKPTAITAGFLALVLLTGCGGGDGDEPGVVSLATGGPAPSATASRSTVEKNKEFAQCLRDNGLKVDDPDPTTGQLDRESLASGDEAATRKALEACRDAMPQAAQQLTNPDAATLEKMRKFAQCMRDEGQDFADPGPDGFDFANFDRDKPGFMDAARACQKKFPFFTPGGGS